jgi:hypothetical protein
MISRLGGRVLGFVFLSSSACALAVAGGCSSDDPATSIAQPGADSSSPAPDGSVAPQLDSGEAPVDASVTDTSAPVDAADGAVALQGCAAHATAAFCDDFDSPDALKAGSTKWDFIEPTDQPVATLSTVQKVSAPSSLLSRVIDATTPGAKFAKTITKANFTEATWEYDVFLENIGTTDGFFLDDFQFTDAAGPDGFGFRLVMFSNAGAIGDFRVEHNANANGGPYVIEPDLPAGSATLNAWHHFKQDVKLAFASGDAGADAGDGGADSITYTLTVDDAATPAFTKTYPGITRAQATFVRFSGMPLIFNKDHSTGLKIYWDNHVTDLK